MLRWALRSLVEARGGFLASTGSVASAFVLALVLEAIFAGEAARIIAYPAATDADVWVMQRGVASMHMASSLVARSWESRLREVEGVAAVTPILYLNGFVEAGGRDWFCYVVGLPPGAERGGPWRMAAGSAEPAPGSVVLPEILARQSGVALGDVVRIKRRPFTVSGLSRETYSMANSVVFVAYEDLAGLLSSSEGASYFLLKAAPSLAPTAVARAIVARFPEINAVDRITFVENDRDLAIQMGLEIVQVMSWVGSALAALIVGFTVYSLVLRRRSELGVMKALGMRSASLHGAVAVQALAIAATGYALALLAVAALPALLSRLVPEVSLVFHAESFLRVGAAALAAAAAAAVVPARRIARLDPASVFRV